MSVPSVSVVITCFNYERYVGAAVRSVLEQTAPPLEVIVVDDGSTDGSARVLRSFGERIRRIEQPNAGPVRAIERGFAATRGDVVLFLDADDLLDAQAIAEIQRAWRPGCAKAQFELEVIDADGLRTGRRFCNYVRPYAQEHVREEFAAFGTYVWPVLSGNAYARWFLERLLPLPVAYGADGVLNTLAPLYGEVAVIQRALAYYRLHGANLSYHAAAAGAIGRRFARQIAIRRNELRLLEEHAQACGRPLPSGDVLDRELTFVNYRLMCKRVGEDYEGAAADSPARLWRAGMAALARRPLPLRLKLAHGAWLCALACSPGWLCRALIHLRFNRAALLQPLRRRAAALPRGGSA